MQQSSNDITLDFGQIFAVLRRGWWIIASTTFIATLIAVILVLNVTPTYTASAQLLLGQKSRVDDAMGALFPTLRLDDATVSGEIAILTSKRMLSKVSERLDLHEHPEFNPALKPSPEGPGLMEKATDGAVDLVKLALGMETERAPAPSPPAGAEESPVRSAAMTGKTALGDQSDYANQLVSGLRVSQRGRSNVLNVRYVSSDRMLAAAVPNTLVDAYLEDQIDRRFGVLSQVTSGLETRLAQMRDRLEAAERAVIDFRNQSLAEGYGSRQQLEQQLGDLTVRLGAVRAENTELAAELRGVDEMIAENGATATVGLFSSPTLERLFEERTVLNERAERLSVQFGDQSPQLAEVNGAIARLEARLTAEITRLRNDRARQLELSDARVAALTAELRALEQRTITQAKRDVQLAELDREQNAALVVYETFLDRFTEIREVVGVQEGDAQVIDYADPPPAPVAPNKKLSAALGAFAGVFFGVAMVFIRHLAVDRIDSLEDLGRVLPDYQLAAIPRFRRLFRKADPLVAALQIRPSPLTEAIRSLRGAVLLGAPSGRSVVVSVVSPLSGAGKTSTAINLARLIARAGRSCVLIDADLRRGEVARLLHMLPIPALTDSLQSRQDDLDTVLQRDPETNLLVMTSDNSVGDPSGALLSKSLRHLISRLRDRFEVVVIDTSPLLSGTDALPLIQQSDAVVMVSPRGGEADELRAAAGKLVRFDLQNKCAVLNFARESDVETYYY